MWLVKNFVFSVFSIVIAVLTLLTKPVNFKGKAANLLLKIWCNGTLFLYGVKVNVFGRESASGGVSDETGRSAEFIPSKAGLTTGKVYISNHLSYLDIFVLLAKVPDNIRMIYKKEINRLPLIGWAMLAAEFVPIDRTNVRSALRSLDKAAKKIKKGLSFVIFPEGTRSIDGSVKEFKRGMFMITEKVDADVVPVSITNTNNLMPRGSLRIKRGIVNLVIGKPLKPKKDREFLNEIRDIVISNLKPV